MAAVFPTLYRVVLVILLVLVILPVIATAFQRNAANADALKLWEGHYAST